MRLLGWTIISNTKHVIGTVGVLFFSVSHFIQFVPDAGPVLCIPGDE